MERRRHAGMCRTIACAPIIVMSVVLGTAAGAQTPEKTYDEVVAAIEPLILGDEAAKIAAAGKLGALRAVYSVSALDKALGDPSVAVRKAVVKALGAIAHKSAAKALLRAAGDEDQEVAILAIQLLGDMHIDESYSALTKILGSTKDAARKEAALDGLRKWNLPFTPLPAAVTIPEGKKEPVVPEPKKPETPVEPPAPAPAPVPEKGKKPEIKIVETKPIPPAAGISIKEIETTPGAKGTTVPSVLAPDMSQARDVLEGASPGMANCIEDFDIDPPSVPVELTLTSGGYVSQIDVQREIGSAAWKCVRDTLAGLEFPPSTASYSIKHEFTAEPPLVGPDEVEEEEEVPEEDVQKEPAITPPPISLEMWDLAQASSVTFQASTASIGSSEEGSRYGRVFTMELKGGYLGKYLGGGITIPFSGASSPRGQFNGERVIFDNLGLWLRFAGSRVLGPVELRYGAALTVYVPSGSKVEWNQYADEDDAKYLPAMGAYYLNYYRHGLGYPDLQDSFQAAVRPDVDLGLGIGPMSFQLEVGLDFIVLGDAYNPDASWQIDMDLDEVFMLHLGFGAAVQPIPWLQLSMELTSIFELAGASGVTWAYDEEEKGERAGSEAFLTPSVSVLLPISGAGSGHVTVGLRVPLGEIGSLAGPMEVDPMLVVATGMRFY